MGIKSPMVQSMVSPMVQRVVGALRWFLTFDGSTSYMTMPAWSPNGALCRINFAFVADNPGTGEQLLTDNVASDHDLSIVVTTARLRYSYIDADTVTARTVDGPVIVAGGRYTGYIEYKADGLDLVVNGATFSSADVPEPLVGLTHAAASSAALLFFAGVIYNLHLEDLNASPSGDRNYPIDDNSTTTAKDTINAANNGTLVNVIAGDWKFE